MDDLSSRLALLQSERRRHPACHRAVEQAGKGSAFATSVDVAKHPNRGRPVVRREQCVLGGLRVDQLCQISPGDGGVRMRQGFGVRRRPILLEAIHVGGKEGAIIMLLKTWQQSLQRRLDVAHRANCYGMASAYMRRIRIDLDDFRLVRVELGPGEIGSEQKQHIRVENGMIARRSANYASHADIVGIVVFEEVLAPRGMGHWRFQPRRSSNHLVMCAGAAGTGVNGDRLALVENRCDLIEVRVTRANERRARMNSIRRLIVGSGVGDVRRYDEYRDAASR
jgi:hypothetical protein